MDMFEMASFYGDFSFIMEVEGLGNCSEKVQGTMVAANFFEDVPF